MSAIAIWSFFTKLDTDISKAHYVFSEGCFVSMYGGLINNGQELGVGPYVHFQFRFSFTAVSEK